MSCIYVFCPSYIVSGGPEALHQMVYYLNKNGIETYLVYCDLLSKEYEIPKPYKIYVNEYKLVREVIDDNENAIILPETLNFYIKKYSKAKIYLWWLGIGNNFKAKSSLFTTKLKNRKKMISTLKKKNKLLNLVHFIKYKRYCFENEKENIFHLCASYYVADYVKKHTKNRYYMCIEPISLWLLQSPKVGMKDGKNNCNTVLYNPARNPEFIRKIEKYTSEIDFLPLSGYEQSDLVELFQNSKLYVDFGAFPGAERIPKEAVINGCCILTSQSGAAAFYQDVPIPDKYKFDVCDENIPEITNMIIEMLSHYDTYCKDFDEYRKMVYKLEDNFIDALKNIFNDWINK